VFGVCLGCHTFALKKLAVMVNGTTYTEKLRLNTRNENRVIDTIISFGTSSAFLNNCLPFLPHNSII